MYIDEVGANYVRAKYVRAMYVRARRSIVYKDTGTGIYNNDVRAGYLKRPKNSALVTKKAEMSLYSTE